MTRLTLVLLSFALFFSGCKGDARSRAGAVMHALEQLRNADNTDKHALLGNLASLSCEEPVTCEARDRCEQAYRHLVDGVELQQQLKGEIDQLEKTPAADSLKLAQMAQALDHAETEINTAREQLPACEAAAVTLRRTYGL